MPLYVRVTPSFDPDSFEGLLMAFEDPGAAALFTEQGYDTFDPSDEPRIHECTLLANQIADQDLVDAVADGLGLQRLMSPETMRQVFGHADGLVVEEGMDFDGLLRRDDVRAVLTEQGYGAARGFVVIENTQPEAVIVWRPGVLSLGERIDPVLLRDPETGFGRA